ncbi:hypothetical protein GWC95_12495 [Sediminibacterium roseum]|uniref:WD40-like Beta Propeller Repeat n=1 Tax=Sediminibacterium roseum TaxID=1978412 RepID=A0ABW9ZWY3_9BACT|nr:hypothetical protein [Sediminibacterium roseum]NCI50749.1 hypothetical protein [Sediminibacterium roseum]
MRQGFLFVIFFVFAVCNLNAQQFGGNPSSVKWMQVNTDTVRVIFPQGYDAKAQRIANIIHSLQQNHSHSIGDKIRKVNIVLQHQALFSNGYVGLAPYRSEFYLTPLQDPFQLGANNWADQLAVHEFRHVQQYSNFNKGLSKLAHILLGEQGQVVANAASVPDWFFEGDAVFNETKLTQQGRGTLPLFISNYQSLYIANRQYSYMKMRNGSLRDFVPDHYDLGYLLVGYGRKKYGEDIWRKITDDASRFKPLVYPFQGAVKNNTGVSFTQFVNDAMQYYKQQWALVPTVQPQWITAKAEHDVVNYQYPYRAGNGSFIVLKNSRRQVPAFYRISENGKEEKIAVKDISPDNYFSYNNGRIVYAASQPDLRWGNREFNSIRVLDVATGEQQTVANGTKYFSPDISRDGKNIIAVEMDPLSGSRIVLINQQGILFDSLPRSGIVFSHPKFAADDAHYYVASRNAGGQMALVKYSLRDNGAGEILVPLSNRLIGFLNVQNDTLLFTTTYEGKDELWAIVDGKERKGPFRLASYATGIYQGLLKDSTLIGSAFTADGYRLAAFKPLWQRVDIKDELKERYLNNVFSNDVFSPREKAMLDSLPQHQYDVSKYRKSHNLLNIHSYRPYYEPPEYSFTLYGQNVLNTLQSELAYTYNENEGSHKAGYSGIYGGSYLQPLFGISHTWNRTGLYRPDTTVHWNELAGYAGLQLPLNLSGGKQYRYLTLSSTYNLNRVKWTGIGKSLFRDADIQYLQSRISFTSQSQKAAQQIYPHFAQNIFLQYRNIVNQYKGHQFLASGALYFPGLMNSHSIVLTAAFHSRDTLQQYLFANNFPFARGYSAVDFPDMWKLGVNYHFPVAYPDWGFDNIVYFLRVRSNVFFDYTEGKSRRTGMVTPFRTVGTELFFDTRWWNQQTVTFGLRYSRLLDNQFRGATNPDVWEFILPVNLFN